MTTLFQQLEADLTANGFSIQYKDLSKPWGGYFAIDEAQAPQFIEKYFPQHSLDGIPTGTALKPKILIVAPQKRLSWQYHHRRAEIWRVVTGPVGVMMSETDDETTVGQYNPGEIITMEKGVRHRLVGLDGWGVVAEIWQHTDPTSPSDEDDIVRVQDDFGR